MVIRMIKKDFLRSATEFNNAFLHQLIIEVWQDGEIIDYGGIIERHSKFEVIINGMHYLKHANEFRLKNSPEP